MVQVLQKVNSESYDWDFLPGMNTKLYANFRKKFKLTRTYNVYRGADELDIDTSIPLVELLNSIGNILSQPLSLIPGKIYIGSEIPRDINVNDCLQLIYLQSLAFTQHYCPKYVYAYDDRLHKFHIYDTTDHISKLPIFELIEFEEDYTDITYIF